MVFAAGAAAGGVFRAGIVVTARLRAVNALRQLSQILLQSNNAFIRFGRSTLIASGAIEVLRRSIGLLVNPVTGVLALLQTGLATRRWLQYEMAVRRARVQLDLMGVQADVVNTRLNEMTVRLGRMTAREIFQAGLALENLFSPKLGEDLLITILDIVEAFKDVEGVDPALLGQALAGLKLGGEEAFAALRILEGMFPGLIEQGDSLNDIFEKIAAAAAKIGEASTITNIERLGDKIDEINDKLDPVLGKMSDVATLLPLAALTVVETLLSMVEAFVKGIPAILEPLSLALSLEFQAALGKLLEDENLTSALTFAGGALGFKLGGPMGAAAGVAFGFFLGRGLNEVIKEGDFTQVMATIGAGIGLLIGGPLVAAIGLAIGFTIGNVINLALGKAISTTEFVTSMAVIGGIIGFLIAGPIGAAIGAGIGGIIGALTQRFKDLSIVESLRQIGRDIGNEVVRGINEALRLAGGLLRLLQRIFSIGPPVIGQPPTIPSFADGGVVPGPRGAPMLAMVHGGERVSRADDDRVINIFIGDEKIDTVLVNRLTKIAKRQGISPRGLRSL